VWLQQDFSVYIVGMFDTGQASRALRLPGGFSLANLVQHYLGIKLDKKYQTADWRERPVQIEMAQYARMDTLFALLLRLRQKCAPLAAECWCKRGWGCRCIGARRHR
jgi:exosome complex exonuclease RRP6